MRRQLFGIVILSGALTCLSACSTNHLGWTGKNVVRGAFDAVLGFPAATVVTGAGNAFAASSEREHERNVDELNDAYSEFLRSRAEHPGVAENDEIPVIVEPARF